MKWTVAHLCIMLPAISPQILVNQDGVNHGLYSLLGQLLHHPGCDPLYSLHAAAPDLLLPAMARIQKLFIFQVLHQLVRVLEYSIVLQRLRNPVVCKHCELVNADHPPLPTTLKQAPDICHQNLSTLVKAHFCSLKSAAVSKAREVVQYELQQMWS